MTKRSIFRKCVIGWAVLAICVPSAAFSASPQAPPVVDVRLQQDATLVGQVVDPQGAAQAGASVALRSGSRELAVRTTDPKGLFAFRGLNQGVYQVASGTSTRQFRVWPGQTAPPAAQPGALMVVGDNVVRGQQPIGNLFASPIIMVGAVGAAVAVPVAVANSHDRHSPASP